MRTIIAGSRSMQMADVDAALASCPWVREITEVVSGCARGADRCGEVWAAEREIQVKLFPADWKTGRGAGFIRNCQMAAYADALVAVWDGKSNGTRHMINVATDGGLRVFVWTAAAG